LPQHLDRSDWVPDFTDPEVPRPDEQDDHNLKKYQLDLLNKLYHLQYRRSLDSWFVDGGYLSKPLAEAQDVFKEAIDGKDEIMH
jgi:hypothetical protein